MEEDFRRDRKTQQRLPGHTNWKSEYCQGNGGRATVLEEFRWHSLS